MASVKRDDVKQAWEDDNEFPLVCETCLGDNPYVRMTKEKYGKKCQVCETPFTVFSWQAGTKGRMKRVEICRNCAQAKNVCQVCIYDLKYGLPVKVRDRVLREQASGAGGGSAGGGSAVPQSIANRAWYTAQQQRMLEQGITDQSQVDDVAHSKLSEMAQMQPRYERNMPKLCSFYAKGECDRGDTCPFRHEMPRDRNDPMSKQSTKDRFYGTSDPVANKILGRKRRQEQVQKSKEEKSGYNKARATLFVQLQSPQPGGAGQPQLPQLTEMDVRDKFYSFGEIVSCRVIANKGQAFVEYTTPEACELAVSSMNRKTLAVQQQEIPMFVAWARAPKRGETDDDDGNNESGGGGGNNRGKQQRRGESSSEKQQQQQSSTGGVKPIEPPGGLKSSKPLPKTSVKLPPEVAAARAAANNATAASSQKNNKSNKMSYPSADPNRLGSKQQQ